MEIYLFAKSYALNKLMIESTSLFGTFDDKMYMLNNNVNLDLEKELCIAIASDDLDLIRFLIFKGVDYRNICIEDLFGDSKLKFCSYKNSYLGSDSIYKALLERKSFVDNIFSSCTHNDFVEYLAGCRVCFQELENNFTYLVKSSPSMFLQRVVEDCVSKKDYALLSLLLDYGVDVNYIMQSGFSVLSTIIFLDNYDLSKKLIGSGVDIDLIDDFGGNSFFVAIRKGNSNIVQLILDNGADMFIKNRRGVSVIELALSEYLEDIGIVEQLLNSLKDSSYSSDVISMVRSYCLKHKNFKALKFLSNWS